MPPKVNQHNQKGFPQNKSTTEGKPNNSQKHYPNTHNTNNNRGGGRNNNNNNNKDKDTHPSNSKDV